MSDDVSMPLSDCWNRIGVAGDKSCPKLEQHIHCRNCEVYAEAARRNLQRPVNEGYRDEWAARLREVQHDKATNDSAALVFRIGREWLAFPAAVVDAVAPLAAPHRVPHRASTALLGVVNVSGKLVPAISLAAMLGIDESGAMQASGRHTFARLVVVRWEGQVYALPAADLHGIVRYPARSIKAPAATINKGIERFLTGVLSHDAMHIGVLDAALMGHQMARLLR
ncbi:chemotaxis protein CheW [Massilia sp. CF038]|uniref:chemotaxis protein CheW n=1 Tax=Massilia sp. CF038 TaxID=1881045 RepID=UPI000921A070|nr:chemotaxis protein CheW [Massilia sp. CF038]SHH12848.1 chemotaxis-related protein WspD [Massilia sp. CF038]